MKSILSAFATLRRGGKMKNAKGKGKKGVKGKKEMYDLIVNIDLAEWRLTVEQVFISFLKSLPVSARHRLNMEVDLQSLFGLHVT
jgi:hypothetical protein